MKKIILLSLFVLMGIFVMAQPPVNFINAYDFSSDATTSRRFVIPIPANYDGTWEIQVNWTTNSSGATLDGTAAVQSTVYSDGYNFWSLYDTGFSVKLDTATYTVISTDTISHQPFADSYLSGSGLSVLLTKGSNDSTVVSAWYILKQ